MFNKKQNPPNQLTVPATSKWTMANDQLPPLHTAVLVVAQHGVKVATLKRDGFSGNLFWNMDNDWLRLSDVSHWTYLPEDK